MSTIIYTKVGCPYCASAKDDMKKRGEAFTEVDVHAAPGAVEKLLELTGGRRIVPVIVRGADVAVGFGGG